MNVFIDESGSFADSTKVDSWNCVVAYVSPEVDTRRMREILARLKRESATPVIDEVKLKDVSERSYFSFLERLDTLNGILFAVATDAGKSSSHVLSHQTAQVELLLKHINKMKFEGGRQGVQFLADQVGALSPQLYVQLTCQVHLIYGVVGNSILYFVQRHPQSLGRFRWRVDQKNTSKIDFEDAFEKVTPGLLQSMSLDEPITMLKGADYSALAAYEYKEGEAPTYLKDAYGIEVDYPGFNIGKLLHEDLTFEDSATNKGVQVADLLASGLRRCLRNGFARNQQAAVLLGRLMVQGQRRPPLLLLGFQDSALQRGSPADNAVNAMIGNCRPMF